MATATGPTPGRLMTCEEAGPRMGLTPLQMERYARKGILPHVRLGRRVLFDPQQLAEWIARGGRRFGPKSA